MPDIRQQLQQQLQQPQNPFAAMQPIQHQNAFVLNMRVYDPDVFNRATAYIAAHQNEAAADDAVPGLVDVVQIVPDQYDALAMATAGMYVQQYAQTRIQEARITGGRRSRGQRQRSRGQRSLSRRHRQSKRRSSRK
jgi:hypothetical protein